MNSILELHNVTKKFSGLVANEDISFDVHRGEILGIVGPNGAGKTTLFNMISGALPITSGRVIFDGVDVTKMKSYQIAKMGMGRTFQIPLSLDQLTVLDNAVVGALSQTDSVKKAKEIAEQKMKLCGIMNNANMYAHSLNVTQKKRLEICRALCLNPKLLLLDETMAGLSSEGRADAIELIKKINSTGVTIIIIEHIMQVIMNLCDRVVVINSGKLLTVGTPDEVTHNQEVIDAYLGGN